MPQKVTVEALGAIVEIDATARTASSFAAITAAWAQSRTHRAPADATVVVPGEHDDDVMLSQLSTDVTLAALAHRKGELWMLHAAGLADERGHTIALVAPSGTGKTTAAQALSRELAYVSDETVGIDSQGGVVAYRKPLSIIESADAPKVQIAADALAGVSWRPFALRLSKVAVLDRDPEGPELPEVTPLAMADALEFLGPQTSYLCDVRGGLRTAATLLEATGGAVRIRYREAETLLPVVQELLDTEPPQLPLTPVPRVLHEPKEESGEGSVRYFHAPVVDELSLDDGRIALLRRGASGGELRVLDGVGPAIWQATAAGGRFDEIHAHVIAVHGEPEGVDTQTALQEALDALVSDGDLAHELAWCLVDDVAWVEEAGRTTVLALNEGQPLALEGPSHSIWQVLSTETAITESTLVARLAEQYGEDPSAVHDDIRDFLKTMNRRGLVGLA
ncbi:PqqD family peptide modification chaperone [Microbacterium keratanolyticum]